MAFRTEKLSPTPPPILEREDCRYNYENHKKKTNGPLKLPIFKRPVDHSEELPEIERKKPKITKSYSGINHNGHVYASSDTKNYRISYEKPKNETMKKNQNTKIVEVSAPRKESRRTQAFVRYDDNTQTQDKTMSVSGRNIKVVEQDIPSSSTLKYAEEVQRLEPKHAEDFDIERVTWPPECKDYFRCCACHEVAQWNIILSCNHLFCASCLTGKEMNCPECKSTIRSARHDVLIEKVINRLNIRPQITPPKQENPFSFRGIQPFPYVSYYSFYYTLLYPETMNW